MRLFEAILDANRRALGGDPRAGLRPSEFAQSLPVVALTCIDPRLNRLMPEVLGVPEEDFIWLRNAGNIIFDPLSTMTRTLALACAVKGGKEVAIIGHTDCRVRQVSVNQLIENFRALGINRASLPDNLIEFFGLFASERQNVINGVAHIRQSPLISPKVPVHGLLVDVQSGRLEWLVNGYEQLDRSVSSPPSAAQVNSVGGDPSPPRNLSASQPKASDTNIGDVNLNAQQWLSEVQLLNHPIPEPPPVVAPPKPHTIPVPPPLRVKKAP